MPVLRDAGWLVALDLGAALALAAAAMGAAGWRGVLRAPARLAPSALRAPLAVMRGLPSIAPIGVSSGGGAQATLRGGLLAGALVLVFGALFVSADGAFAQLVDDLAPGTGLFAELPGRITAAACGAAAAGGLALLAAAPAPAAAAGAPLRRFTPREWTIALSALAALFVAFVAVQFVVLFGGSTHVLDTAGLTYAEYAHSGFGQLLVASGLVLALVAATRRWAEVTAPAQDRLLRALLGVLCASTLVIVAAALHRLDIYVDAFGATRLRVVAACACALIGGLIALVLAALATDRYRWLPQASVALAGAAALALSVANPDGWIAARNVDRYERTGKLDGWYASTLSADAVPALTELPPGLAGEVLRRQAARLAEDDGPFAYNVARQRARNLLPPAP